MATTNIKLKIDTFGNIRLPVTIINPANNKTVNVDILPDTGATASALDNKYARQMGLDIRTGKAQLVNNLSGFYRHRLKLQIGNLKPVTTDFVIGSGANLAVNVIGIPTMVHWANFQFMNGYVTITEYATTPSVTTQKKAAYVEAYKSFYGYPGWYTKRI